MPRKYTKFAEFLHDKITQQNYCVDAICRKAQIARSTLYHYAEGHNTFPVDLVAALYNATKDPDILNFILQDTDQMLTARPEAEGRKSKDEEIVDVMQALGGVIDDIREAFTDGTITRDELEGMISGINLLLKEAEDLRPCILREAESHNG